MSLFKVREYWSVDLQLPDLFDRSSLLVVECSGLTIIFVGSHDGYLRAYCPSSSFNPSDLVYETMFPVPVLDLKMGCLVSGSNERQLVVLHPKSYSVYHILRKDESDGVNISLSHAYQHALRRVAFSIEIGPFGSVSGRDFTCVQSLDGLLSFFEQETSTIETQLPDVLLPSQFRYITTNDSFIFLDMNLHLTCYSYECLSGSERKKLIPSWTHNIGEYVLDINCIYVPEAGMNIIILTERSLYNVDDQGKITWMKRFEMRPMCVYSFLNKTTCSIITLLCTEFNDLHVYQELKLVWCSKLDFIPVAMSVISFGALNGILTFLSDSGYVQCAYLGTIPSLYIIPPVQETEIKVVEAEEELKKLDQKISGTDFGSNVEDILLTVKLIIDNKVNSENYCTVSVELTSHTPINKVQVAFIVEPPLMCIDRETLTVSVCDKETISAVIGLGKGSDPISNLNVSVVVSYVLRNGVPRIIQKQGQLPSDVAMIVCQAAKEAPIKLTLVTNKPTCNFGEIFPEPEATANAVGLMFLHSKSVVSIIAAKTSQRYRLQAESLEDMTLVLATFILKLKQHFRRMPDFSLSYSSQPPLQEFYEVVGRHFELVTRRRLRQEQLAQRTTQYRTIQKKILMSLKDLAPKPSTALYKVLDDTYEMIKACVSELEMLEFELQTSRCRINSFCRLIMCLLELTTIKKADLENLRLAFSQANNDGEDNGWLEIQNATLSLLLRTSFAKSMKDQNKPADLSMEPVSDVGKIFKLFSTLVDRATKGTNLLERSEFEEAKELLPTVPSVKEWETKDVKLVPRGSKMTDITNRSKPEKVRPRKPPPTPEPFMAPIETEATIEVMPRGNLDEIEESEEVDHVKVPNDEPVAADDIVKRLQKVFEEEKRKLNEDREYILEEARENIEDDAIWDLRLDEMRI